MLSLYCCVFLSYAKAHTKAHTHTHACEPREPQTLKCSLLFSLWNIAFASETRAVNSSPNRIGFRIAVLKLQLLEAAVQS